VWFRREYEHAEGDRSRNGLQERVLSDGGPFLRRVESERRKHTRLAPDGLGSERNFLPGLKAGPTAPNSELLPVHGRSADLHYGVCDEPLS
jgi:hypothetical protein